MYALLAALIAIAVIAMMWRFLERESAAADDERREQQPNRPQMPMRAPRPRPRPRTRIVAPDDDPEFLQELSKRIGENRGDEQRPDAT